MKRSLEWHKECLRNQYAYAEIKRIDALRDLDAATQIAKLADEYRAQIELAEARGLTEFDQDR